MTWKSFHSRGEILRTVITTANERLDGVLPMDVDGVAEKFHDDLDLLGTLQLKWHTRLAGRVERVLWAEPMDLRDAVAQAWGDTTDDMPGVRLILDRYRAEPTSPEMATAMGRATDKEHMMLAAMAGRASLYDEVAVPIGAEIENYARTTYRSQVRLAVARAAVREAAEETKPSFRERLRSSVA